MSGAQAALAGSLTIPYAAEKHAELRALAEAGLERLDLSAIEACDASGVQLLLALRRSLRAAGRALRIEPASDAVAEAMRRCGASAND